MARPMNTPATHRGSRAAQVMVNTPSSVETPGSSQGESGQGKRCASSGKKRGRKWLLMLCVLDFNVVVSFCSFHSMLVQSAR